ncbi:MAG: hypothetical protein C6H99_06160 [Epsilonproteobacteria bacterium]|nr:hypothetical protein [Campylobacterota bacterium]NPA65185.1 hypothetical protein [Campylobacterota bacterium]
MFDAQELAKVIAKNIQTSDITIDEAEQIVRLYVRLHNRLYEDRWDEKHYVKTCLEYLRTSKMESRAVS